MAIVAVLWIVAALSVLVIGVTGTVRQQVQAASSLREQVSGRALANAAVALVVQQLQVESQRPTGLADVQVSYSGVVMNVQVAPLNGLISLNGAAPDLLAALLQVAGGLPAAQAQALAETLVEWRDVPPQLSLTGEAGARGQSRRFEAPEDLLLVPGFGYDLYARVAPLVSADLSGTGRVNAEAAPPGVLAVLAQGNEARVAQYVAQRSSAQVGADLSAFNSAFTATGGSDLYRLRVSVPLEAGKMLLLVQDVALRPGASRTAPWRVLRTHSQVAPAAGA
ncbi:type II secretion system protein GspK [Ottowia pentelensis]|uniref:Type II secretion system protein GspK n=2 Tax=Ottowia pentelensis TaxID=511108 RepID=A0ABV6PR24_9BURK